MFETYAELRREGKVKQMTSNDAELEELLEDPGDSSNETKPETTSHLSATEMTVSDWKPDFTVFDKIPSLLRISTVPYLPPSLIPRSSNYSLIWSASRSHHPQMNTFRESKLRNRSSLDEDDEILSCPAHNEVEDMTPNNKKRKIKD